MEGCIVCDGIFGKRRDGLGRQYAKRVLSCKLRRQNVTALRALQILRHYQVNTP